MSEAARVYSSEIPTAPTPKPARAPQRRTEIDHEALTVAVPGVGSFCLGDLPVHVVNYLALRGLARDLLAHDHPREHFNDLKAAALPESKPAVSKRDANPWRAAYAAALVEETCRSVSPHSPATAEAASLRLDAAALRKIKTNPKVVAHYAKITGASASLADLAA